MSYTIIDGTACCVKYNDTAMIDVKINEAGVGDVWFTALSGTGDAKIQAIYDAVIAGNHGSIGTCTYSYPCDNGATERDATVAAITHVDSSFDATGKCQHELNGILEDMMAQDDTRWLDFDGDS